MSELCENQFMLCILACIGFVHPTRNCEFIVRVSMFMVQGTRLIGGGGLQACKNNGWGGLPKRSPLPISPAQDHTLKIQPHAYSHPGLEIPLSSFISYNAMASDICSNIHGYKWTCIGHPWHIAEPSYC